MKKCASFPVAALKYKKYSVLFKQGDRCDGAIVLLQGKVALSIGLSPNRKLQVCDCNEGAILGLAETFTGLTYETTAVAATDVVVQFISHADIVKMASDTSDRGMEVISKLGEQLKDLQKTQMFLAFYLPLSQSKSVC